MLTYLQDSAPQTIEQECGLLASRDEAPSGVTFAAKLPSGHGKAALQAPAERRGGVRIRSIYRTASVRSASMEAACRVHNLSDAGAMIETAHPLGVSSLVELTLSARHRLTAIVMWERDGRAGLQYLGRVDCFSIIREIADDHWSARTAVSC